MAKVLRKHCRTKSRKSQRKEQSGAVLSTRLSMAVALQSSDKLCSLAQDLHRTKPVSIPASVEEGHTPNC